MAADGLDAFIDAIAAAPFHADGWERVVLAAAALTDSWGGQLIAQSGANLTYSAFANVTPEAIEAYVTSGCADPSRSPRLATGLAAAKMRPISDQDYISDLAKDRFPIYKEYYHRHDSYYCCNTRIANVHDLEIVLALFHSKSAGEFDVDQVRLLRQLLPHIRTAIDLTVALESKTSVQAIEAIEAFDLTAIICDGQGRLLATTPRGEALLRTGDFLSVQGGVVRSGNAESAGALEAAIRLIRSGQGLSTPTSTSVVLRTGDGRRMRVARVARTPNDARFSRSILIAVQERRRDDDLAVLRAFGLSPAEAEVGEALSRGLRIEDIAVHRGVSAETVRSQLKSIYSKVGVSGAAQFMARLLDTRS
jgi:DNA-binding CsgD family transcriptional regulator